MTNYTVKLTYFAISQIQETISYISIVLKEPETAKKWVDYLENQIDKLNYMPERFLVVEQEPWKSKGYRKMIIKNFIVYYYVDEKKKTVWVTSVVYGKRDQLNALNEMP